MTAVVDDSPLERSDIVIHYEPASSRYDEPDVDCPALAQRITAHPAQPAARLANRFMFGFALADVYACERPATLRNAG